MIEAERMRTGSRREMREKLPFSWANLEASKKVTSRFGRSALFPTRIIAMSLFARERASDSQEVTWL